MAKAREVERWITVNGNKVPIYKDGGMGGIMSGKSQKLKEWNKESNKGNTDLSGKKIGDQMTVDYNDLDESPEEFKKRAEEEGFKVVGEGGHSVILKKDHLSDKEMKDFVVDYKIPDEPDDKKRISRELADENDAYDKAHKEGRYEDKDVHYDTKLNDIRERMRKGEITAEQAKDEAFDYEKSQRGNKRWNDQDRNNMESKVRDIFDDADRYEKMHTEDRERGEEIKEKMEQRLSELPGRKTYRVHYEDGNQRLLEANSREELDAYLKETEKEYGKATKAEHASEYDKKDTLKSTDLPFGKKESAGGSFEAELEEHSDPEYKNVTKGVKTEKQAGKSIKIGNKEVSISREAIIEAGGDKKIGDYRIEIGRTYNKKADDYSGPFGKKTAVSGPNGTRYFNSTEAAIAWVEKQRKKKK